MPRPMTPLLLLVFAIQSALSAQGITLVADGKSDYVIVRPKQSSPSQVYAAEELQSFVKQMTGAQLPIATDDAPLPPKAILLGLTRHTEAVLGAKPDMAKLGDDGFAIHTRPPHLLIIGSPVRGTLYGAYELLERYGGCRWYTSYYSIIPKHSTWMLPAIDNAQTPAFVMREPFWWCMFPGDFAARCRANGNRMQLEEKHGGKIRFGGGLFVHTFYRLVPPSKFFAAHPEYFSLVNGKRKAERAQLCLTNNEVRIILTKRLRERMRKDPDAKLYSVSQNDCGGCCTCPRCAAIDAIEGSHAGTLIPFVNRVAAAIQAEFPKAWIETLAYNYTRHPPLHVRPRANVVPRLCTIECDFSLPLNVSPYEQNVKFVQDIKGWSAMTDKLYIWDYTTNFGHYIGPHPNFNCLQGNVKFFRDNHVVGVFEQGAYQGSHAEFAELRAWVLAKLLWNPDQDIEALYQDFFNGYYGPAAKPIRAYFDELQALTKSPDNILRIWFPPTEKYYTDEFFDRAAKLWAEAERRVANDKQLSYNVRMSAIPVLYARLVRMGKQQVRYVWRDSMLKPEGVDPKYAALAAELLARLREGKVRVCESIDRHRQFIAMLEGCTEGYKPISISAAGWRAGVAPQLGGRLCALSRGDGANFINPNAGGVDFVNSTRSMTRRDSNPYRVLKATKSSVHLQRVLRRQYRIDTAVKLSGKGLSVATALTSLRAEEQTIRPVMRAALDLGDAAAVVAKAGRGDWLKVVVPEDQTRASGSLTAADAACGEVLVASAATGRGVRIRFPGVKPDRVRIVCDVRAPTVQAYVLTPLGQLAGHATAKYRLEVEPIEHVSGLPKLAAPKKHRADKVVIEECDIRLGRIGKWGDFVADDQANDGFAAKLFNTHFEWCLQHRLDVAALEPGAKYKVRMRIRVDKSERQGEAFWAGVYDYGKKRSCGQIAPKTTEVKDGYQWYDIVTWTPEDRQYVWVGPGRFDKKGGKRSAINALYVDKFELVRVK